MIFQQYAKLSNMDNAEDKWEEWDAKSDECGIAPSEIRNAYKQALREMIEKEYRKSSSIYRLFTKEELNKILDTVTP